MVLPPPETRHLDAGCGTLPPMSYPSVSIETTNGTIKVELWDDAAPKHVENFLELAREGAEELFISH